MDKRERPVFENVGEDMDSSEESNLLVQRVDRPKIGDFHLEVSILQVSMGLTCLPLR